MANNRMPAASEWKQEREETVTRWVFCVYRGGCDEVGVVCLQRGM